MHLKAYLMTVSQAIDCQDNCNCPGHVNELRSDTSISELNLLLFESRYYKVTSQINVLKLKRSCSEN